MAQGGQNSFGCWQHKKKKHRAIFLGTRFKPRISNSGPIACPTWVGLVVSVEIIRFLSLWCFMGSRAAALRLRDHWGEWEKGWPGPPEVDVPGVAGTEIIERSEFGLGSEARAVVFI